MLPWTRPRGYPRYPGCAARPANQARHAICSSARHAAHGTTRGIVRRTISSVTPSDHDHLKITMRALAPLPAGDHVLSQAAAATQRAPAPASIPEAYKREHRSATPAWPSRRRRPRVSRYRGGWCRGALPWLEERKHRPCPVAWDPLWQKFGDDTQPKPVHTSLHCTTAAAASLAANALSATTALPSGCSE